jgi:uncharacterized protein (TIGR03118 family)
MVTHSLSRTLAVTAGVAAVGAAAATFALLPAQAGDQGGRNNSFREVRLVADRHGQARTTDPQLVNPWGLAASPTSPLWVSNNGTSTSTLYQGITSGKPVMKVPLNVKIPGGGAPTGVVYNPTGGFKLSSGGKSGPALFIFAGEDGDISAWNKSGDIKKAVLVAKSRHAIYKGLAMVRTGGKEYLLAADFHDNRVDVFDEHFRHVTAPHAFSSKEVPHGYAPFGIADLDRRVYVTYAKQDKNKEDDVAGRGNGFVNVFDESGRFRESLVRHGALDSPWGLAIAPHGFGSFAGKLLVGNFGDGRIHVVDQHDGRVVATLLGKGHHPIAIDGLWGLLPGNGTSGDRSDVWFSAGPDDESHGLLGILEQR